MHNLRECAYLFRSVESQERGNKVVVDVEDGELAR